MTVGNIHFPLADVTMSGAVLDPYRQLTYDEGRNPGLLWGLEIDALKQDKLETPNEPRFYCDGLNFQLNRWLDLEGKIVQFTNEDESGAQATSFFFSHEPTPYSTLTIGKRTGRTFSIHWEGVCDPYLEEPFHLNVPFLIEAEAILRGVRVNGSERDTDATMLERLARYLDPNDFIQHPIQQLGRYDSGVGMSYSLFEPRLL